MNRKKAVSYARFSSGAQAKGTSLERQKLAFAAWIKDHAEQYEPLYFADAGVSAYKGKNAANGDLARLLKLITDGVLQPGDVIVVEAIDRLSRQNTLNSFDLLREILSSGVRIITLENNQEYDKNSADSPLIYSLIAGIQAAHQYSRRLGERVAAAHQAKRARARAKQDIPRLATVPWIEGSKLKEPYAGLVRAAIDLYLRGHGTRAITQKLQPAIAADNNLKERYQKLNATTIRKWLKSQELIGNWESKDGIIEGCFEPLITNLQFLQIKKEATKRLKTPSKGNDYALSGIVKCAACGCSFHTRRQRPKPTKAAPIGSKAYEAKPYILYCNCASYLKNGNCKNKATWAYDVLLFVYRYGLTNAMAHAYMAQNSGSDDLKLKDYEEKAANLQLKIDRQAELYAITGDKKYLDEVALRTRQLELIKAESLALQHQTVAAQAIPFVGSTYSLTSYERLPLLELRSMLKQLGYEVLVQGKTASLSFSPEGREEFTLVRRLQKPVNCYLLRVELPEVPDVTENHWVKYFAIGPQGIKLTQGESEADVIESLTNPS